MKKNPARTAEQEKQYQQLSDQLDAAGFVPVDFVEGLPAGVQLVGRRFREDVILDAMAAIEQRAGSMVKRLWAC